MKITCCILQSTFSTRNQHNERLNYVQKYEVTARPFSMNNTIIVLYCILFCIYFRSMRPWHSRWAFHMIHFRAAIVRRPWAENQGPLPKVPMLIGLSHSMLQCGWSLYDDEWWEDWKSATSYCFFQKCVGSFSRSRIEHWIKPTSI
jgi:hypothetical protein